ncbi:MAG: PAS domain S-box protein [Campylobacteraceae bacterium]|nr:PAS domain S-box protein [Campylobacteraceae bacterium]
MNKEHILDKNIMIVSETDSKGIIIYVNEDFCVISCYIKDELIGNPHNVIRHIRQIFKQYLLFPKYHFKLIFYH